MGSVYSNTACGNIAQLYSQICLAIQLDSQLDRPGYNAKYFWRHSSQLYSPQLFHIFTFRYILRKAGWLQLATTYIHLCLRFKMVYQHLRYLLSLWTQGKVQVLVLCMYVQPKMLNCLFFFYFFLHLPYRQYSFRREGKLTKIFHVRLGGKVKVLVFRECMYV